MFNNNDLPEKWEKFGDLKQGMIVTGRISNIKKYGVFIDIGKNISGLLHIEDISISRIKSPSERFSIGQKVNVVIKQIDFDSKRIIFSHKELLGNWEENVQDFEEKTVVDGTIKDVDQYKNGVFIELKPNLVGLAEYKDGLKYGEKVKVYIKKIIKEKKKIKLLII